MKKRFLLFLTALMLLFSVLPVYAEEMTAEQRVFDYADLLSEADEREMHLWIEEMQKNWNMDLAYLTTNDTEGKSVQQYGADFYVEHDLGLGESPMEVFLREKMSRMENPSLATYAKPSEVRLRATAKATSVEQAEAMLSPVV